MVNPRRCLVDTACGQCGKCCRQARHQPRSQGAIPVADALVPQRSAQGCVDGLAQGGERFVWQLVLGCKVGEGALHGPWLRVHRWWGSGDEQHGGGDQQQVKRLDQVFRCVAQLPAAEGKGEPSSMPSM